MNPSRSTEIKVGLFTLVGLALLFFGIIWGRQLSIGGQFQTLAIRFPTSSGLIEGDGVTVNGLRKGRVDKIEIEGNNILVHVTLEKDVLIHSDATATIIMLELMGGKKIDIRPGVSPILLDPSTIIRGVTAEDIPGVISIVGSLSGDLTRVMFRLDTLLGAMNSLMTDKKMIESIRHAIFTLDATATMVKTLIARNEGNVEVTITNLKTLVTEVKDFFQANRAQFEKILKNTDKTFTSVDATVAHADSALVSINKILDEVKNGNGTAHRIIYDKDFGARLDSTISNATRLVNSIIDNGVNVNIRIGTRP